MRQRTIRLATTSARVATGAVIAAACVLGVVGAVGAPLPGIRNEAARTTVEPVPGDTVLVCNGSFRALGRDSRRADLMVSAALPQTRVDTEGEPPAAMPLAMPDVAGGDRAQTLTSTASGRDVAAISAAESIALDAEDARGFAAAPCREPAMSAWLVGGDVTTGASDVVLLSNPGDVPATVDFTVFGEDRAASSIVVPPRTQRGVPLASISEGEQHPVVHVVATGAPVRATLQSTLVRTLDAVGIDLQDGITGAQERTHLIGVEAQPLTEGDDAAGVVLRLLSPEIPAQATVRVRESGSSGVVEQYTVSLEQALPIELALPSLAAGVYDIEIESTAPTVAAARQSTHAGSRMDFAWMTPAPEITTGVVFSVPSGPSATLRLRNDEESPITVSVTGRVSETVEIPASGSASVALPEGGYALGTSGAVHAAVTMRGTGDSAHIAGWPLWPGAPNQQPIIVNE